MGRSELMLMGVVLMSHDWMKCPLEIEENNMTQRIFSVKVEVEEHKDTQSIDIY